MDPAAPAWYTPNSKGGDGRCTMPHFLVSLAFLLASIAFAHAALAADGVLEVNQTCAVVTGCFSGDAPGFPVTIDGIAGRSIRLTGDLEIGDADVTAIDAVVDDVTVDLGGFRIHGVTVCEGLSTVTSCAPTGSGIGVRLMSQSEVRNGSVLGMGADGVRVSSGALVTDVRVRWNGNFGIVANVGATVRDSVARQNGSTGIFVGPSSSVWDNTSTANGGEGIRANVSTSIGRNTTSSNGLDGISAVGNSAIQGNTVSGNGGVGISGGAACTIVGNAVVSSDLDGILAGQGTTINDNTASFNGTDATHDGIECSLGCVVQANAVRSNTGYGLRFNSGSSAFFDNSISGNTAGTVVNGTPTGGNVCGGSLGCP